MPPLLQKLASPITSAMSSVGSTIGRDAGAVANWAGNVTGINRSTPSPYVIAGLKPKQPGGVNTGQTNTLPSSQTAPTSQQKTTGGASGISSYKGVQITPGNDASVASQIAKIDSQNASSGSPLPPPPTQPLAQSGQLPLSGNVQTPSGATVNTGTGSLVTPPPASPATPFAGMVSDLSAFNPMSNPQVSGAYQQAQNINGQIASSQKNEANDIATNRLNPIPIGDQTGRQAVIQQQYQSQQAALGSELQGQSNLYNAGLNATNQQLGAQTSAAGLAQPSTAAYGQTVFNPTTGQYSEGGGLPASTLQQYAQMAANGQYSAIPTSITSNPQLSAELNAAAKQINPNYNPLTSQAQGAATAQNTTTAGTAQTSAANTGYQQAVQDYGNMTATNSAADAQISQVKNVLSGTGLNQGVPDYNTAINALQTKLGSTAYTQLVTSITELQNMYSQLLSSSGTTPTGSESQSLALLNPNSSADQINASISQLQTAAYNRLQAQYGKMQTFQNNLGSSNASSGSLSGASGGWSSLGD